MSEDDLKRVGKATGASIQTSVTDLIPSILGTCGLFEERQIGSERYNFFTQCKNVRSRQSSLLTSALTCFLAACVHYPPSWRWRAVQ